ncbi:2-octaprenyl-6-methoxyphenol hydroxylase [Cohaesibacter sp. ES.047]|uniref:UbiH/UbiF family hydroxylase n=1 Tax=Cohaesibacter sp. ES.047 TaxID=1798205 RepID=UPI000BB817FF|nr:UbiH/UbiF family hydroxylase [Cohaesibacter sp. ES.047]SNY93334.1 2-octaprenyl-6-methoxyphenol hydroxylase [Cohaesibacter sp. ES.047]
MSNEREIDIAIVGSGPAGHVAALQMARLGFSTVLIGPAHAGTDGRTTALLGSSAQYLESLGLWDAVRARGQALRVMRLVDDTGRLFRAPTTEFDSSEIGLEAFGYNIDNNLLVEALDEGLEGIDSSLLHQDQQFAKSVELHDDHALIEMADGSAWRAKLAIAADGRKSLVKDAAGIEMRKWGYPQAAMVVNLSHPSTPHGNASTEFHTPTGPFTLVPYRDGRTSSLVCVVTSETAERLKAMDKDALEAELERRAHSIYGAFELASEPQVFPLSGMVAKAFHGKRAAMIAESAHVFPPIGAQGLNLSLRDIEALAKAITSQGEQDGTRDPGSDQVLSSYGSARLADIWSRTAGVHMLNMSLLSSLPFGQGARTAGLALANMVPPLRKFMMKAGLDAPTRIGKLGNALRKSDL